MRWFWVRFHYDGDGYYTVEAWELVAAPSAASIAETWGGPNSYGKVMDIVPLDMAPIPKTPRRTKHPRVFDPRRRQP
jgi:hypothetical protein